MEEVIQKQSFSLSRLGKNNNEQYRNKSSQVHINRVLNLDIVFDLSILILLHSQCLSYGVSVLYVFARMGYFQRVREEGDEMLNNTKPIAIISVPNSAALSKTKKKT